VFQTKKIVLLLFVTTKLNLFNVLINNVLLMLKNVNRFLLYVGMENLLVLIILAKLNSQIVTLKMDVISKLHSNVLMDLVHQHLLMDLENKDVNHK